MKRILSILGLVAMAACSARKGPAIPLSKDPRPAPELTLVWVGTGKTHRFEDGVWKRTPDYDYEFTVTQRRYKDHWESVKDLHRRHPDYDGKWAPRDQSFAFGLAYAPGGAGPALSGTVVSTLGPGRFTTDREFGKGLIEIKAEVSAMAPFDSYRISQDYHYEQGRLVETVELLDSRKGGRAWVRNDEEAVLFASRRFDGPPTRR